jgi:hypothetical protein
MLIRLNLIRLLLLRNVPRVLLLGRVMGRQLTDWDATSNTLTCGVAGMSHLQI